MIFALKVIAKSKQNKVVKISNAEYKIYVTAAPERGRANEKVIELLAGYLDIPKSSIKIIRGETSNHKKIEIRP